MNIPDEQSTVYMWRNGFRVDLNEWTEKIGRSGPRQMNHIIIPSPKKHLTNGMKEPENSAQYSSPYGGQLSSWEIKNKASIPV